MMPYRTSFVRPIEAPDVDVALFGVTTRRARRARRFRSLAVIALVSSAASLFPFAFLLQANTAPVPASARLLTVRVVVQWPCGGMNERERARFEADSRHTLECFDGWF
jgi:hypothetical protein